MARVAPGGKTDEELQTMARLEHARKQKWRSYIDEETGCAYYFTRRRARSHGTPRPR